MRVFEENLNENTKEIWLNEENVRHVVRVMRHEAGDKLTVCDGNGKDNAHPSDIFRMIAEWIEK